MAAGIPEIEHLLGRLRGVCRSFYGDRLVSLVVFGSVGRGTPRLDSDVDLLVVADPLPDGRIPRVREFEEVERSVAVNGSVGGELYLSKGAFSDVVREAQEAVELTPGSAPRWRAK